MKEGQHVVSLLTQLERWWEEERIRVPDAPALGEIWGVAMREHGKGFGKYLSLYEMLSLVHQTADQCWKATQKGHVKNFQKFFRRALMNRVLRHLGLDKRGMKRREQLKAYAYDTRRREFVYAPSPLEQWVNEAVGDLRPDDGWLIGMVYWEDYGIRELAKEMGKDKSWLSREHQRILGSLKRKFVEDCWQMVDSNQLAA